MNDLAEPTFTPQVRLRIGRMQPNTEAAQWGALSRCRHCGAKAAPHPAGREWRVRVRHEPECPRRPAASRDRRFTAVED